MADWSGSQTDPEQVYYPPPTVRIPRVPSTLSPDTEENVTEQTSDVFRNFLYESYRQDQIRLEYDSMPTVTALNNISETPQSPTSEIGRQLALIGDDINEQYADVFEDMIHKLRLTPDTAYEAFEGVAKKLFQNEMNWGRILMLLFFGYRMAMSVLRTHYGRFSNFLTRITEYVVRFFVNERISRWIAERGGWRAALSFVPSISSGQFLFITALAVASVAAVYFLHK